jgi:Domain of unknown function (DUF1937)
MAEPGRHGMFYFAHPYTMKGPDGQYVFEAEEANFRMCSMRAGYLLQWGFNIYAPICHSHPIHMHTPRFLANEEHAVWYGLDNDFISRMRWDGIILAPEWQSSKGCRAEVMMFIRELKLPVLYYASIEREHRWASRIEDGPSPSRWQTCVVCGLTSPCECIRTMLEETPA